MLDNRSVLSYAAERLVASTWSGDGSRLASAVLGRLDRYSFSLLCTPSGYVERAIGRLDDESRHLSLSESLGCFEQWWDEVTATNSLDLVVLDDLAKRGNAYMDLEAVTFDGDRVLRRSSAGTPSDAVQMLSTGASFRTVAFAVAPDAALKLGGDGASLDDASVQHLAESVDHLILSVFDGECFVILGRGDARKSLDKPEHIERFSLENCDGQMITAEFVLRDPDKPAVLVSHAQPSRDATMHMFIESVVWQVAAENGSSALRFNHGDEIDHRTLQAAYQELANRSDNQRTVVVSHDNSCALVAAVDRPDVAHFLVAPGSLEIATVQSPIAIFRRQADSIRSTRWITGAELRSMANDFATFLEAQTQEHSTT